MKAIYFFGRSIYLRLIIVFVAVTIPLHVLAILMYNSSIVAIKEDLINSMIVKEKHYIEQLELEIENIKGLQISSLADQEWALLSTSEMPITDYYVLRMFVSAQQRLKSIQNSAPYINDVRAHMRVIQKTISASRGLLSFNENEYNTIRKPLGAKGAQFLSNNNKIYLSSSYKSNVLPLVNIVVELDKQALAESLSQFNLYADSFTMMLSLNDSMDTIVSDFSRLEFNTSELASKLNQDSGSFSIGLNDQTFISVYYQSPYLGYTLMNMTNTEDLYAPLKKYDLFIRIYYVAAISILLLFLFSTYRLIKKPMAELVSAFRKLEYGKFDTRIRRNSKDEFGFLFLIFNKMTRNLEQLINEVYKKEILIQKANVKQLQAQINPHFLYNSFYILHRMIKIGDNETAESFSRYLGKYLKYVTRNAKDEVPLSMEVEHARIYAEIMAIRQGDRVIVEFSSLSDRMQHMIVPRLILQPLIENAFEHGVWDKSENGRIEAHFFQDGSDLIIKVEDNGQGIAQDRLDELSSAMESGDEQVESTGVVNIHKRIRLRYGSGYGIEIVASDSGGFQIKLRLMIVEESQ